MKLFDKLKKLFCVICFMTLLWIFNAFTPCFTLKVCVELHLLESRKFIYRVNVFCPSCTATWTASHRYCQHWWVWRLVCHFQSSSLLDWRCIFCSNTACSVLVFSASTRNTASVFLLKASVVNVLTSNQLSWDANGLGLPLETLLGVTFLSCEWMIRSQTRTSWKLLWVIRP